jgi:hypothetical protein
MQEVRLETADGKYVTTGIVPPFKTMPSVLIWGERVFKLHTTIFKGDAPLLYREVFAVAVVQTRQD